MAYKRLFIWLEGTDDEMLFTKIFRPIFLLEYDWVEVRLYASLKKGYVDRFITSIDAMDADYILVTDINSSPCISSKKEKISERFEYVNKEKISVVIKEIESWYIAGLNQAESQRLKLPWIEQTNELTKEEFNKLIPTHFNSRIDFMLEILNCYSIDVAIQKNQSISYFVKKFIRSTAK
ncbi:hypothetical protein JW960_25230 [candidate division KSB1 bacterium]|nr:hypothetical protein [candidate division KSB1 bacterium]